MEPENISEQSPINLPVQSNCSWWYYPVSWFVQFITFTLVLALFGAGLTIAALALLDLIGFAQQYNLFVVLGVYGFAVAGSVVIGLKLGKKYHSHYFISANLLAAVAAILLLTFASVFSLYGNDRESYGEQSALRSAQMNLRATAELYYNQNDFSYEGFCESEYVQEVHAKADLLTAQSKVHNHLLTCKAAKESYAVEIPYFEPMQDRFWCVSANAEPVASSSSVISDNATCLSGSEVVAEKRMLSFELEKSNEAMSGYMVRFYNNFSYPGTYLGGELPLTIKFGDGNSDSIEDTVRHEYEAPGTYRVTLEGCNPNVDLFCEQIELARTTIHVSDNPLRARQTLDTDYTFFSPRCTGGYCYEPVFVVDSDGNSREIITSNPGGSGLLSEDGTKVLFVHPNESALALCGSGMWEDIPRAHNTVSVLDLETGDLNQEVKLDRNFTVEATWTEGDEAIQVNTFVLPLVTSQAEDPNAGSEVSYPCLDELNKLTSISYQTWPGAEKINVASYERTPETQFLTTRAYLEGNTIYAADGGSAEIMFTNIDINSFEGVPELAARKYGPVADGGYQPWHFQDDNYVYCVAGKGQPESVKLAQPIELSFEPLTDPYDPSDGISEAERNSWQKRDTGEYGNLSFVNTETGQRYDMQCNSLLSVYTDTEIGISFIQPVDWQVEKGETCGYRLLSSRDDGFLSAFSKTEVLTCSDAIGPSWHIMASGVTSEYLNECEAKTNCEIVVSEYGVQFTKEVTFVDDSMGPGICGENGEATGSVYGGDEANCKINSIYRAYRNTGEFDGFVFNTAPLDPLSDNRDKIIKDFENTVVRSFRFTE